MHPNSPPYIQEDELFQAMQGPVAELWEQRNEGLVSATDGKKLFWVSLTSPSHTRAIVVVNGRIESAWKYQELFYDLFHQGFDIYSFDHRGQGLSERLLDSHPDRGYVGHFNDYILDLASLISFFPLGKYQQRFLLAHSMGCTITARYLQTTPNHPFDRVAFCSPMFGINIPAHLKPISGPYSWLLRTFNPIETYAPGQTDYCVKPFEDNPLTRSQNRYQWFRELYDKMNQLQLGGSTIHWVWQSLSAIRTCLRQARKIHIPALLLQAEKDEIVDNQAQITFFRRQKKHCPDSEFNVFEGSRHEILFEQDATRNQALDMIIHFFTQKA
ncbi:lysophospholipase [Vibrio albus]|uniref:Lysophospholipase n=2 Tax=Vibrio albus TaxID=2200953 RepID=A0A2U3B507_9VIBR|nr:alpha/beta fold hydrolase [Vibrio albus]PWI31880.1 lysophospholipase [Vibrio albus]